MAGENFYALEAQLRVPDTVGKHISSGEMATALEQFQIEISRIIRILKVNEKAVVKDEYSVQVGINYYLRGITTEQTTGGGANRFKIGCYCNGGDGGGD